ncbi:MAG: ATP-binding protein [Okeania sp. SIO2F4]|uniref:hypothetical protein n=1 Tax=Okeania sp. SIO2F4 TaxID=2607790 RepID=UPI00142B7735|nr:hypothetical protein [Okeania sp. SIO2F4]NES02784.1 ATP-binding protein [Okeania sp. SIO2F4]
MVLDNLIVCFGCLIFACFPQPKLTRSALAITAIYYGIKGTQAAHQEIHEAIITQIIDESEINMLATEADLKVAALQQTCEGYSVESKPTQNMLEATAINHFDWKKLNTNPNKYVHLIIVGGTGDGKSFTTERLAPHLGGKVVVCNPHDQPGDFEGFSSYCGSRNYGNWKKDKLPVIPDKGQFFQDFLDKKIDFEPSVCQFIKIIEQEMNRRYELYHQGDFYYPMVNVILDEFCVASGKIDQGVEVVLDLIKEARKVLIRLFLLVKYDQVKTLKIEGQGDIRKSLTYVRLGEFAHKHSQKLGNSELYNWCLSQERPILVEDEPAVLPESVRYVFVEGHVESESSGNQSSSQASTNHKQTKLNNEEDEDTNVAETAPNQDAPTLEEIEDKILSFCAAKKTTVRQVQQKFSKYKLAADTIWQIFQGFAEKNLGTVAEKKVGGSVIRIFTPEQHRDV